MLSMKMWHFDIIVILAKHLVECIFDSPFVVLAIEEAIEYVTEGADMVEIVQDDHSGELCVRLL